VTWQVFIVLVLAAARIHRLIAYDEITEPIRARYFSAHDRFCHWLQCPWCFGFWLTIFVFAGWEIRHVWALVACVPLAASELVGLVASKVDT
jgi:hypothetical protein